METFNDHLSDIREIRNLMEKSSRFISLSGLSGIFAGIFAIAGAAAAWWYLDIVQLNENYSYSSLQHAYFFLITDAAIVLTVALTSGVFFTVRQARKKGQSIWDKTSRRLLINIAIPLATGGFFCLVLLYYGQPALIAPATLLFYGLALLNGSKYTFDDIRYLAYIEILLGMLSCFYIGYGLLFWAVGFGVMHIVYGTLMYFKYEK